MTLHLHHLTGCAPAPLAHYLKALGVLRLVAEQADADARGWWQDEHFCLLTRLDRGELTRFFLEEFAPTPVFNPWGARSGFYPGSSEKSARKALMTIEASELRRLDELKATFQEIRSILKEVGGKKPDDDEEQNRLLGLLRARVRGAGENWLDTVKVLVGTAYRSPALMGTGGNEGSGSYTSAYLSALVACLINRSADDELALFSGTDSERGPIQRHTWDGSFGQFVPEGWGSAWDLLLAIEGSLLFRSAVTLSSSGSQRFLASPFYFAPRAGGAGTSSVFDEVVVNKGRTSPGRGEQWFPLWRSPVAFKELQALLAEGRCSNRKTHARGALDVARAIGQLGVARGLNEFSRYGYLQRNNLATHFAVPLARIKVAHRSTAGLADELAGWLDAVQRRAREKQAPQRLVERERHLANAVFDALTSAETPSRWQAVLSAATAIEDLQASGVGVKAGPIPPLSPSWLTATDDGSPEWRLAAALGSAAARYGRGGRPLDPVRHHWLPLQRGARRYNEKEKRLVRDPRVVITGRDALGDCAGLVERRLIEAAQRGQRTLPLVAARGFAAQPADLARLISGEVDLDRVMMLARAFMAVRWELADRPARRAAVESWPEEGWLAIRLAHVPWPVASERAFPTDEAIVRRLTSGDSAAAVELALRRLRAGGLRPPLRAAVTTTDAARRWAAALAFPIDLHTARAVARRLEPRALRENQ